MKRLVILLVLSACLVPAMAQTDSIRSESLPEVVVNADGQIETAEKAVLLPTTLEKKHSSNGFDLLNVMQTAELEVSPRTRSISTHSGGEVVLMINGMEAQPEDVATLRSKNIRSIEYVRAPSGKYAGKAGLVNFITIKMEYGGNVYLSASEGLAYKNGDYLAFADYTRKGLTLSLIASGDWAHDHSYSDGHENFTFSDNSILTRDFSSLLSIRKSDNEAVRFKLTSTGKNHRLNTYVSLTRQGVPSTEAITGTKYTGSYNAASERHNSSDSRGLAPALYANYTLWLPKDQTLDFTASTSFGHNKYNSHYYETSQEDITSSVKEDNNAIHGNARYYKSWKNGLMFSSSVSHDHKHYKDTYNGSSSGRERLTTDVTMGLLQLSGSSKKYYYYVSGGVSNSAVSLNGSHYDYCVPVAFYGGNYAVNRKNSFSLNGLFTHTLFDPSNKNDMTLPTSFFEAVKGNPVLAPLKVLGNTLSYNGQFGKSKVSVSYNSNIYFDNIVHQYTADEATIYDTHINDGNFYGNMFTATYAYSAFSDKLRMSLTAIEEYNLLRGDVYDMERNAFRVRASVTYLTGDWMIKLNYRSPYKTLDIREPYLISRRPEYELLVSWNHKAWAVEALLHNPFSRYDKQHITMDYGCYHRDTWNYNESDGRLINLKLTYSIGYGKKQKMGNTDIDKKLNSAIMRTY